MSTARLALILLVVTLIGAPLIGFTWETLSDLLSGRVDAPRLLMTVPVLTIFGALLWLLARSVDRWYLERHA